MSLPNPIIISVPAGNTPLDFHFDGQQVEIPTEKLKEFLRNYKNEVSQAISSSPAASIPLGRPEVKRTRRSVLENSKENTSKGQMQGSTSEPEEVKGAILFTVAPPITPLKKTRKVSKQSPISAVKKVEEAEVSGGFYLKQVIDERGNIYLYLNGALRPPTSISGSQGDHVTPYRILLQMICNLTKGEEVSAAAEVLRDSIICFLDPESLPEGSINNLILINQVTGEKVALQARIEAIKKLLTPRERRKEVTGFLRSPEAAQKIPSLSPPSSSSAASSSSPSSGEIQQRNVDVMRDSMVRGDQVLFAQLIVELGESILTLYQKQPFVTLPKLKGYGTNDAKNTEGYRVKESICHLRLIDEFLIFKENFLNFQSDNDPTELITLLEKFYERRNDIISSSFPNIINVELYEEHFLEALQAIEVNKESFVSLSKILDDIYKLPKLTFSSVKTSANSFVAMLEHADLSKIGDLFNAIFDFHREKFKVSRKEEGSVVEDEGKEKIVLKNPRKRLCEVAKKHLDFMFTSFKGMRKLSNEYFEGIIICFCRKVAAKEGQDWGSLVLTSGKINMETFEQELLKFFVAKYLKGPSEGGKKRNNVGFK